MARQRLINCEFINASSFRTNVSNKGKLLYMFMFLNGDDRGFVDTTNDIINALEKNDNEYTKEVNLTLLGNDYKCALNELIDKGYLYQFEDNHNNRVHLIRHWFLHNKYKQGLWTNYRTFLELVYLENGEYKLGKKPLKEDNNKINYNKPNHNKVVEETTEEKPREDGLNEEDYPFDLD